MSIEENYFRGEWIIPNNSIVLYRGRFALVRKIADNKTDINCKCDLILWGRIDRPYNYEQINTNIRELTYFCSGREFKFLGIIYPSAFNHEADAHSQFSMPMAKGQDSTYLVNLQ